MQPVISVTELSKTYPSGLRALEDVHLEVSKGEIFALLGPNGAGKTTLIGTVCGTVMPTSGSITVAGFDVVRQYRKARALIGLVPQELTTNAFEKVWDEVVFSRGLFGRGPDPAYLERLLRDLSLWEKRKSPVMTLSGGMKRRLLIAKALSHEPEVLFLDEPTAGVDVSLRRDMWNLVHGLRERGVTIILTTHYIEEAEEMADRIGIINHGKLILVEDKKALMKKLGRRQLLLNLRDPLDRLPPSLSRWNLVLDSERQILRYEFDENEPEPTLPALLEQLAHEGIDFLDLKTQQTSLEEIFVDLVSSAERPNAV